MEHVTPKAEDIHLGSLNVQSEEIRCGDDMRIRDDLFENRDLI